MWLFRYSKLVEVKAARYEMRIFGETLRIATAINPA